MDYKPLSQRLEITFWTYLILLIKTLHRPGRSLARLLMLFAFICACILIALLVSPRVTEAMPAMVSLPDSAASSLAPRAASGQHNTLLILVETQDFASLPGGSPRLITVWLMAYSTELMQPNFLPVYPALAGSMAQDQLLAASFAVEPGGRLSATFVDALAARRLWWDAYLVFDLTSLAALVNLAGGIDEPYGVLNGAQVANLLGNLSQPPQAVVQLQAQVFQTLCQRSGEIFQTADPQSVLGLFANHSHSNLDWQCVQARWHDLRQSGSTLACKFPTLEK